MKKIVLGCSVAAVALGLSFGVSMAGNGAPSGAHYNLNIIGVEKGKTSDMTDSSRHTIFVDLGRNGSVATKIYLTEGEFQVCDGNGFDAAYDCSGEVVGRNDGAVFQLPNNGCWLEDCGTYEPDSQVYEVYVRALGTPGGNGTITTCVETYVDDGLGGVTEEDVCSTENVILQRNAGPSKFVNKTQELTTIVLAENIYNKDSVQVGTQDVRYGLFEQEFGDYFWNYDNAGLKLVQLRFYGLAQ